MSLFDKFNPVKKKYLSNLDNYECTAVDHSLLRTHITNKFYNRIIFIMPRWIAPNMITLIGTSGIMFSCILSFCYSPHLENSDIPSWVFFLNGFLLWFYQTMDNLDGKQARRTKNCSPLGELFDHGCDSLTGTFGQVAFLIIGACGPTFYTFVVVVAVSLQFIFDNWAEYHLGKMEFGYLNGPNEGLFFAYTFQMIGALLGGQAFFHQTISTATGLNFFPFTVLEIWEGTLYFAIFASVFDVFQCIVKVYIKKGGGGGVIGSVPGLIPSGGVLLITSLWILFEPYVYIRHTSWFIVNFGLLFAFEISNMTLSFLLKMKLRSLSIPLGIYAFIFVLELFTTSLVMKEAMFFVMLIVSLVVYLHLVFCVCLTISSHLKINILRINKVEIQ